MTMDVSFQGRAVRWAKRCFSYQPLLLISKRERMLRFLEEALELVQVGELTPEDVDNMRDHVFNRNVGEIRDEIGGTLVCLALVCDVTNEDMNLAGELGLTKCWEKIHTIKEKHKAKPATIRDQSIDLGP